jgi:hypothetical protein
MKSISSFKILIPVFFIGLPINATWAQSGTSWEKLKSAYAAYIEIPSAKNIERVNGDITECANAPIETPVSPYVEPSSTRSQRATDEYIMSHLDVLKKRVRFGDQASIGMAYRLLTISDDEFSEDLTEILDKPIHRNPELFLKCLVENRKCLERTGGLNDLLTFMGTAFSDQPDQPKKEYRLRIRDLKKVSNPGLKDIRDECIKILMDEIQKLE